jgi:capsular polysaccharide biosynthesis protein
LLAVVTADWDVLTLEVATDVVLVEPGLPDWVVGLLHPAKAREAAMLMMITSAAVLLCMHLLLNKGARKHACLNWAESNSYLHTAQGQALRKKAC